MPQQDPVASRPRHPALPAAGWVVLCIAAPLALLLSVVGALSLAAAATTIGARASEIRAGAGAEEYGTEGWLEPEPEPAPEAEPEPQREYPPGTIGLDDPIDFGAAPAWRLATPGGWEEFDGILGDAAYYSYSSGCEVYLSARGDSVVTDADLESGRRGASTALAEAMMLAHFSARTHSYPGGTVSEEQPTTSRALALGSWQGDARLEFAQLDGSYVEDEVTHLVTSYARKDIDGQGGYASFLVDCVLTPNDGAPSPPALTVDFVLDLG
ncbi:hypothetical protein ROT00_13655 [Agromyces mediolanus]|uniref:hypothetical protein n=1 Tax=Agromyces mediolanus TaxID=41986 RepID=UPI003833729B